MLVGAAAWQPYCPLEQFVSCAPSALTKPRVFPHMGGVFGLRGAGSGRKAQPVPMECRSQRKGCDLQVSGGRYGQVGTIPPFLTFFSSCVIMQRHSNYFFVTKGHAK